MVGLSTDEFNEEKGKKTYFKYSDRKKIVESVRYVDLVIPEKSWDQKESDKKEYRIDIFVMGSDWEGKFENCVYVPRTEGISTTEIKDAI